MPSVVVVVQALDGVAMRQVPPSGGRARAGRSPRESPRCDPPARDHAPRAVSKASKRASRHAASSRVRSGRAAAAVRLSTLGQSRSSEVWDRARHGPRVEERIGLRDARAPRWPRRPRGRGDRGRRAPPTIGARPRRRDQAGRARRGGARGSVRPGEGGAAGLGSWRGGGRPRLLRRVAHRTRATEHEERQRGAKQRQARMGRCINPSVA